MGRINDFVEVVATTPLLQPVFSGINTAFVGTLSGLGSAANVFVGLGFTGGVIGKFFKR